MNVALWIVQVLIGAMFIMAGVMKGFQPSKVKTNPKMAWAAEYSTGMIGFIGIAELLGGIGLIVPAATGIAPILTPIAAAALAVVMALAIVVHVRRKEAPGPSVFLFAASLFVAIGRFIVGPL